MASFQTCSGCGKGHTFRAVHSVQLVCYHCRQLIFRNKPAASGKTLVATREDMSVLRVGTTGKCEKGSFEIVGRVQHFYQEGYRNLWYLLYQNGGEGWLGDWEGGYSLLTSYKTKYDLGLPNGKPGKQIKAFDAQYELRRIGRHLLSCYEGELPELLQRGESFMAYELGNEHEQLVLVHAYGNQELEAFAGTYEHFRDFSFNQLRPHHEWV